tara:strand:- start:3780 stop:4004 length:225 start_codon:yes stop_codon:yes gene_type:complete
MITSKANMLLILKWRMTMTPTQAIKQIDTAIKQVIANTNDKEAEKLKKAYEVVKKDYQDKINLTVIRTDHSLYM